MKRLMKCFAIIVIAVIICSVYYDYRTREIEGDLINDYLDEIKEKGYSDIAMIESPFSADDIIFYSAEHPGLSCRSLSSEVISYMKSPIAESNSLGGLGIYTEMTVGELFYEQYNEYLMKLIPKSIDYSFHLNLVMPNFYFSKEDVNNKQKLLERFGQYKDWSVVTLSIMVEDNDQLDIAEMNKIVEQANKYSAELFEHTKYQCYTFIAKGDINEYPEYLLYELFHQEGIVLKHRFRDYLAKGY